MNEQILMKKFIIHLFLIKKHFYSSLKDGKRDKVNKHISDEEFKHLQNVWDTFNFNIFDGFHNHY